MKDSHSRNVKIVQSSASAGRARHVENRIIGGLETVKGRYPYIAEINFSPQDPGPILENHACGGVLINPNVVLTSRECFSDPSLDTFQLVLGAYNLSEIDTDSGIEKFNITNNETSVKLSPDVTSELALVYLNKASKKIPVQLNFDNSLPDVNQKVTTIGWGLTEREGSNSNVLLQVELDVISNSQCFEKLEGGVDMTNQILCTFTAGKDVCTNDQGGPLIIPGEEATQDVLLGIVSIGESCDRDFPSLSSRVSTAIEWIEENAILPTNSPSNVPTSFHSNSPSSAPIKKTKGAKSVKSVKSSKNKSGKSGKNKSGKSGRNRKRKRKRGKNKK